MNARQYVKAMLRHTRVNRKTKRRLREDLLQDIEARLSSGQTMEQILQDMGEPAELAEKLQSGCELIRPYTTPEKILLVACVVFSIFTAFQLLSVVGLLLRPAFANTAAVGIIGGADGPTAVVITASIHPVAYVIWILAAICLATLILLRRRR